MTMAVGAPVVLGVKDKVCEVLLLGLHAKVVVSNAVPLVEEKAGKANDEEERHADSKTGDSNYVKSVVFLLQGLFT